MENYNNLTTGDKIKYTTILLIPTIVISMMCNSFNNQTIEKRPQREFARDLPTSHLDNNPINAALIKDDVPDKKVYYYKSSRKQSYFEDDIADYIEDNPDIINEYLDR